VAGIASDAEFHASSSRNNRFQSCGPQIIRVAETFSMDCSKRQSQHEEQFAMETSKALCVSFHGNRKRRTLNVQSVTAASEGKHR
jgi:hypothetical protein